MAWLTKNEVATLIEESEDILDGLEAMQSEANGGFTEEVLIDTIEIITAVMVAHEMKDQQLTPVFHKAGKMTSGSIRKTDRAKSMIKMGDEMR